LFLLIGYLILLIKCCRANTDEKHDVSREDIRTNDDGYFNELEVLVVINKLVKYIWGWLTKRA